MGEMESIRAHYGVPARRGMRVRFTYPPGACEGVITSAEDHKLWIRTDDGRRFGPLHPTWHMVYVTKPPRKPKKKAPHSDPRSA
jgi:hypothetical protein